MPHRLIEQSQWRVRPALTIILFIALAGSVAVMRLYVLGERFVTLSYGLPLLLCLWYPSRRLLGALMATFVAMATYKAFASLPDLSATDRWLEWSMQIANVAIIGASVYVILSLLDKVHEKHAVLANTNRDLVTREEEISRQNEELQAQAEELAQQNEEIERQAEELQQQTEELELQTEELQRANRAVVQRQDVLETMLRVLHIDSTTDAPQHICESALLLFSHEAVAAAIVLRSGDQLEVVGRAGEISAGQTRWALSHSLAQVAIEQERPSAIADLRFRPDIVVPSAKGGAFAGILAAPLWLGGEPVGALEFYSNRPHEWTHEQFRIADWAASQCSLIIEARRLRDALQKSNTELEVEVQDRTKELQELVNELEHFSYTITHDLRAPLRAMQGYAGILEEEHGAALDATARGYLRRIAVSATRMDQLITDALSYSRAVRQEFTLVPVDANALIQGMLESYPNFQPPKVRIEIEKPLPPVLANEAGLAQCMSNLLGNAVKFVPPGVQPHVRISSEQVDGMVRLWIEDNGIGIAPEMQPRLFSMFQRLSKDYEGTGIGLALVRKVAERMGGKVGVESQLGRGSRFWLMLKPVPAAGA